MTRVLFVRCGVHHLRHPGPNETFVLLAHASLTECRVRNCRDALRWQVVRDVRLGSFAREQFGTRLIGRNLFASQKHRHLGGLVMEHGSLSDDLRFECRCEGPAHEVGLDAATALRAFNAADQAGKDAIYLPRWGSLKASA